MLGPPGNMLANPLPIHVQRHSQSDCMHASAKTRVRLQKTPSPQLLGNVNHKSEKSQNRSPFDLPEDLVHLRRFAQDILGTDSLLARIRSQKR